MRRFSDILLLLTIMVFAGARAGCEEWDPDRWIREQVELQYSEILSAIKPADTGIVSFAGEMESMGDDRYAALDRALSGISVSGIEKLYGSGFMTVREYIVYCLKKADESEKKGMNIVIQVNPDLMAEVEGLESGGMAGRPLYGIPVVLKANIGTAGGLETTAGAAALKGAFLDEDPLIIKKIREAGGIIFAKVNLSEWANYMTERSSNGFSALGGQTRNPYGRFDVGGSSSGSAAAVAFGIAPLALGTETSGSVIYPASQNSVVGFKPALGEVSRDGIIPLADAQDTAGPMAGHVKDAVLLYGVIRGYDERDMSTAHKGEPVSYEGLSSKGLNGLSIGVVSNESMEKYLYREGDLSILKRIRRELRHAGAKVTELNMDEGIYEELDVNTVFLHQFHEGVNAFAGNRLRGCGVKDLTGIVLFNENDPAARMPLGQTLLIRSLGSRVSGDLCDYIAARNKEAASAALDVMMEKADVLMTLSNYLSYIYAAAGYPAICVPAGYRDDGEPVGVTFIAAPGAEKTLFEAAFSYESATGHRIAP